MAYTERFVTDAASGGDGNDNLGLALVNATYDHTGNGEGERHLSLAGAFSGYTFVAGDKIYLENAVGGITVPALYEIASRVDDDAILLVADAGLTADSTTDVDSSAGPWTLAESLTNAVAGDRVNVQSDSGYALGADAVTNSGTFSQLICFRGYNSTIGDLEGSGWNADGSLVTTNFPIITLSGNLSIGASGNHFVLFQNIVFTGSVSGDLVGDTSADHWGALECSFTNTANSASASAVHGDNGVRLVNCDCECTGAAHDAVVDCDNNAVIHGCRILGLDAGVAILRIDSGVVLDSLLRGTSGAGIGILRTAVVGAGSAGSVIVGNTFYDLETAIQLPNTAPTGTLFVANNQATDCGEWINNLYSGTANLAIIEVNNRTRDNTTPRTGVGDGANVGEVTTDTGGIETDYVDAGSNNFRLISAAPGKAIGVRNYADAGAYQREEAGGGGLLVHPGTSGGARG